MSEFYMIEAEESFIEDIDDVTRRIESVIKTVTNNLLDSHANEINDAYKRMNSGEKITDDEDRFHWLQKPFVTVTYAEAAEILENHTPNFDKKSGLSKSDELALVNHFQAPIFVVHWPRDMKPFYMRACKHNAELVSRKKNL